MARKRNKNKKTKSAYRSIMPRTLQIADRRNLSQTLRFVTNQTYLVKPGGNVGGMENVYLSIRANSIYNIMKDNGSHNAATTWTSQDPTAYGSSVSPNATGWDQWNTRYRHFTVLGSKISITYEPTGVDASLNPVPTTVYVNLSGATGTIAVGSEMSVINKLPYTKRASIVPNLNQPGNGKIYGGVRLTQSYSAKKFEGVKDVLDNKQLSGQFSGVLPEEKSYYTVGLRNTIPSGATNDRMQAGIMRIKVEYITRCSEPTDTNFVQARETILID